MSAFNDPFGDDEDISYNDFSDEDLREMMASETNDETIAILEEELEKRRLAKAVPSAPLPKTVAVTSAPAASSNNMGMFEEFTDQDLLNGLMTEEDEDYRQLMQEELERRGAKAPVNAESPVVQPKALIEEKKEQVIEPIIVKSEAPLEEEEEILPQNVRQPVVQTEAPLVQTEAPLVQTETPLVQEEEEEEILQENVQPPVLQTKSPLEEKKEQVDEPVMIEQQQAPLVQTEAPLVQTEAPLVQTEAPVVKTPSPIAIQETPIDVIVPQEEKYPVEEPIKKKKKKKMPIFLEEDKPVESAAATAYDAMPDRELLDLWNTMPLSDERNLLIKALQKKNLFPSDAIRDWEYDTGAYPDIMDPEFLQKLLAKREFAESLQTTWKPRTNPCQDNTTFEVAPFQRFVANFMSPKTPYMSALLFYGVGVGKTCGGIQIAEAWLESYPHHEVFIVSPPTIQQGFYRTIFDISKVTIGQGSEPNTASQCTGTTYMKLSNTLYERDPARIEREVQKLIRRRYKILGYVSFANYIQKLLAGIPEGIAPEIAEEIKKKAIRDEFSGKLLIVDEAHNLRDIVDSGDGMEEALAGGKAEKTDTLGGKMLTPYLLQVLRYAEGLKFCALTATPMYNSYREIIFMVNLLLMNDKKAILSERDVFDSQGNLHDEGKNILRWIAQRYICFMRGENPVSFPIRLFPESIPARGAYPTQTPRGLPLEDAADQFVQRLPIVPIPLGGDTLRASVTFMNQLTKTGTGMSTIDLDRLIHAGNIVVPATEGTAGTSDKAYRARTDANALSTVFDSQVRGGEVTYYSKEDVDPRWMLEEEIAAYSPKFQFFLQRARQAEGCVFAYTRFINSGALPLALALEANGYTVAGRKTPLFGNGVIAAGGRQCALCPYKEKEHGAVRGHAFTPAYYGILTGTNTISPNNEQTILLQRSFENATGVRMKIIIGSQIASEGVDLRFIRETHVLDAWYHLNKTEQILGRSIRFLSHCALPSDKRNVTVYLYTAVLPVEVQDPRETADQYCYRVAFDKSTKIGKVTRVLKQSALDCNLNKNAIVISGQAPVRQIDAQGRVRPEVNINDMPFTAVCDWIETCDYSCQPQIDVKGMKAFDDSSYDEYTARHRIHEIKKRIRYLFSSEGQPFYQSEDLWNLLSDVPRVIAIDLLNEIVNNRDFQVRHGDRVGYIRYCNGYYLFQPNIYPDLTIPLAVRVARFPIKRDEYYPAAMEELPEMAIEEEKRNTTQTIESVWTAITAWAERLATVSTYTPPPNELNQFRYDHAPYDEEKQMKMLQMLEMIRWFHTSFHASRQGVANAFRRMVLFYFWDEWFTLEEQMFLLASAKVDVSECVQESRYPSRRMMVDRLLDPKNGEVVYRCTDQSIGKAAACPQVMVDLILKDENDPLRQTIIHARNTGEPYGFIAPKDGRMVFKTNKLPGPDGKIRKGEECANVSVTRGHMTKLIQIGAMMKEAGMTDFDLNPVSLYGPREISNSNRICTLLDLFLRYLDEVRLQHKRWFYRAVPAYYTGHRGMFHPAAATAPKAKAKVAAAKPVAAAAAASASGEIRLPMRRKPAK